MTNIKLGGAIFRHIKDIEAIDFDKLNSLKLVHKEIFERMNKVSTFDQGRETSIAITMLFSKAARAIGDDFRVTALAIMKSIVDEEMLESEISMIEQQYLDPVGKTNLSYIDYSSYYLGSILNGINLVNKNSLTNISRIKEFLDVIYNAYVINLGENLTTKEIPSLEMIIRQMGKMLHIERIVIPSIINTYSKKTKTIIRSANYKKLLGNYMPIGHLGQLTIDEHVALN